MKLAAEGLVIAGIAIDDAVEDVVGRPLVETLVA